jgi:hypothetical protein
MIIKSTDNFIHSGNTHILSTYYFQVLFKGLEIQTSFHFLLDEPLLSVVKKIHRLRVVAQACNPTNLRVGDQEDHGSRPAWAKCS